MSVIVTTGIPLTATLWQRDRSRLTSLPPTILHPRSVLMLYSSSVPPARTSLGVYACEQSYPISNPTLQSNRSCISCSIDCRFSQFVAIFLVGTCSSLAGIHVLVKATGISILTSELYPLTWRLETLWLSMSEFWLVMVLCGSFIGRVSALNSLQVSLRTNVASLYVSSLFHHETSQSSNFMSSIRFSM